MAKFRKKPVIVEALQWAHMGDHQGVSRYADTVSVMRHEVCPKCGAAYIDHGLCPTLEGSHIVCPGDWIICGIKGEFYPCKPDIFEATYEPA
jgi:ribosomal protein L32